MRTPVAATPAAVLAAAVTGSPASFGWIGAGRVAFGVRGGFAAAFPLASALAAALSADFAGLPPVSRFALRFPGRLLGRFPSTPPSSAMDGDSSRGGSGYRGAVTAVDKVV
jgi:hypothetical protein